MSEQPGSQDRHGGLAGWSFRARLWSVAGVALALRLVLQRFEPPPPRGVVADEQWYVALAHNVLHGKGFVSVFYPLVDTQTALHGPLTVFLLMPATLLQPHGYGLQRATIGVVGALTVVVVGLVARELGGERLGIIAAMLAAVYPGFWVNDMVATSESPAILLLAVILLVSIRYRRAPSTPKLLALGALLGMLALDRAELAVLGLALVVPAVVRPVRDGTRSWREAAASIGLALLVAVGVVAPWSAYNQARFHQTVLISNNLGQTLVGANCKESYFGPLTGYDGRKCFLAVRPLANPNANEAQQDAHYRNAAVDYALHHWHRWPVVGAMRELWLWSLWKPGWTVFMAGVYIGRPAWAAWTQISSFWLLTPLAIYGFVVARRRRTLIAPLITMVAFTALLGLLVVGHLRYRVPAELAFVLTGAIALDELCFERRSRGAPS